MAIPLDMKKFRDKKPIQEVATTYHQDDYLVALNGLVRLCARQGYQLHRYSTTSDIRVDGPRVSSRYALHPLGLPRPAQYRSCEGGLLFEVRGREGVSWACHAYATLQDATARIEAEQWVRSPGSVPDYLYARDGQGTPIYMATNNNTKRV